MAINSLFTEYKKKTPATVQAYQWLPDDKEQTTEIVAWLMHYRRTRFVIEPSDESIVDSKQLIGFQHNGQGWNDYAWPGDWIIRDGPNAYTVMDDDDFKALYGDDTVDDSV